MIAAEEIKRTLDNIVCTYETRIQNVESIFDAAHNILNGFQESFLDTREEREKINTQLRDVLAGNEHLRRKDFNQMMQGILASQGKREKEVRNLLNHYLNTEREMVYSLRDNLAKAKDALTRGNLHRIREFQTLNEEIFAKQEKRKQEAISLLKGFRKEQEDLAIGLRDLLAKGNSLRIKDLKSMLTGFKKGGEERRVFQKERKEEVAGMLAGFKNEREKRKGEKNGNR